MGARLQLSSLPVRGWGGPEGGRGAAATGELL